MMLVTPKISVVTPVYVGVANLDERVASDVQRRFRDLEIVIMNVASTDDVSKNYVLKFIQFRGLGTLREMSRSAEVEVVERSVIAMNKFKGNSER